MTKTYKGPGRKKIQVNFDERIVEFIDYTFERFLPKRYPAKRLPFESIGTMNSQWVIGGGDDMRVLLTKEGRTILSTDIEDFEEVTYTLDQIYQNNIKDMSRSQIKKSEMQMLKTPLPGKVLIATLLAIGAMSVIYYFVEVLPNL